MIYTDDPLADFERYDRKLAREEAKLPVCCCCDNAIYDDYCIEFNDELYCFECIKKYYTKRTEDYIE